MCICNASNFQKNFFLTFFSIPFLIGSLCLYQPSIFVFLSCFTLIWLYKISSQEFALKDVTLTAMKAILSFLLSYLVYSKCILSYISFSNTRSELIFASSGSYEHITLYFKTVFSQLESLYESGYETSLMLLLISLIAGIAAMMKSPAKIKRKTPLYNNIGHDWSSCMFYFDIHANSNFKRGNNGT